MSFAAKPREEVSHCGCALPEGCFGSDGWHQARYDEMAIAEKVRTLLVFANDAKKRNRIGEEESFVDQANWWADNGKSYLGTAYAFEPCPAYRGKIQRDASRQAAGVAAGRGRQLE